MPGVRRPAVVLAAAAATVALAAGCGENPAQNDYAPNIDVVATTAHMGDLARAVGGSRINLKVLIPRNADPHAYEPKPSDAKALAEADVVLQSGGAVDAWLDDVLESAGGDAEPVKLIDAVQTRRGPGGEVDPHWWQDPTNVLRATDRIRDAFAKAQPVGKNAFTQPAATYAGRVRSLDRVIAGCMASIPASRRKLVTGHDSFGYFADRYDIDVLGSITPALSSSAQPSAGDVRRLVAAIRRERVRTIFPESALNQRLERAVARDAGVKVGPPLYADTLGPADTEGSSYLGALRHDAAAMAKGFGGKCDFPPLT